MLEIYKDEKDDLGKKIETSKKNEKKLDSCLEVVYSIGLAMSASSLLTMNMDNNNLLAMTGATILLTPPIYFGLKKIKETIEERVNRDMHQTGQLVLMFKEVHNRDRKIESMTSLFLDEIFNKFEAENIIFPEEQIMNINQFLYLINANYYERIEEKNKDITRDELIDKIVTAVSIYLIDSEKETFDETDAIRVLFYCPFIEESLKNEIAKEFKKSKVMVAGKPIYEIVRNDIIASIDEYKKKHEAEENGLYKGFDINESSDYQELIMSYALDPYYLEKGYRDPRDVDWDLGFFKKVVQLIVRDHREELLKTNSYYSNYNLASSLVSNTLMYALVNNKDIVDQDVVINSFKTWEYIPFQTKLSVLDTLFTEEDIDFSKHPFKISQKKKEKPIQKIIEFKPRKQIESE